MTFRDILLRRTPGYSTAAHSGIFYSGAPYVVIFSKFENFLGLSQKKGSVCPTRARRTFRMLDWEKYRAFRHNIG